MFGLLGSLGFRLGAIAGIALVAFVAGWRVESWRWDASNASVAIENAKKIVAMQQQINAASNADMEQINDLNTRLTVAKEKLRRDHLTGVCFDAGSLRDINSTIAGQAPASR